MIFCKLYCINDSLCSMQPDSIPVFVIINESEFNKKCKWLCVSNESESSESCLSVWLSTPVCHSESLCKFCTHLSGFFHCIGWSSVSKNLTTSSSTWVHVKLNAYITINSPLVDIFYPVIKIQSFWQNLDHMVGCSESHLENLCGNFSHPPIFSIVFVLWINCTIVFV